ncbi:MAG: hypothetical protein LBD94_00875 [Rickettsiales bacterium]|nr:hypothetical protein [Rickettsiales bacterium]
MQGWIDIFSLSWVVPLVLDSMMAVAMAVYDYFVGGGNGIIYMLIWGWLAFSIGLYLIKMYFPKKWLELFGLSGGGEMWDGKADGWSIGKSVLKPMLRAMFAIVILLQVRPHYITHFVINPFLGFGSIYVNSITSTILPNAAPSPQKCPDDLGEYLSKDSCEFLVQPIDNISRVNNTIIQRGFDFLFSGFSGVGIANSRTGGFLNIITGLMLIATFFSSNLFMVLLIIQGIIKFGLSLILYPFRVLVYVVKPDTSEMWVNPWPAFEDMVESLKKLIIAMIAVAFILLVNISIAGALFNFDPDSIQGFGGHSVTWLTAIMTFWLMYEVFKITNERLRKYVNDSEMTDFYQHVADNAKRVYKNTADWGVKAWKIMTEKSDKK